MAQLGVVYRFMLREWRDRDSGNRQLGSIDNAGTSLFSVAPELFQSIYYERYIEGLDDPQPQVTFKQLVPVEERHRAAALLNHHQYGSRGVLNRFLQGDRTPFDEIDNQQTDVAIVLSAPPLRSVGFIGLHVPHRRGVKTGVEAELRRLFRDYYGLHLIMEPVVPLDAVATAIEQAGVGVVSFRRLNNPTDLFAEDSEWWTAGRELAKVELRLSPPRFGRLLGQKIVTFLRTREEQGRNQEASITFDELVTIGGQTYDEMSVEVFLEGRKKVMRIDPTSHWMSQAFSWDLQINAGATPAEIVAALAELLPE